MGEERCGRTIRVGQVDFVALIGSPARGHVPARIRRNLCDVITGGMTCNIEGVRNGITGVDKIGVRSRVASPAEPTPRLLSCNAAKF